MLTSCSTDDNSITDPTSSIFPKTVKSIYPTNPSNNSTYTYVFDGNKIVSMRTEQWINEFTYEGNVIVKEVGYNYNILSGKGEKISEHKYTYVNNKLVESSYVQSFNAYFQSKVRTVYTYNSDGSVKIEKYNIDIVTGIETKDDVITVLTYANGNLVKEVETNTRPGSNYVGTNAWEYDSKKNPFKNVLGFNLLLFHRPSVNNIVKGSYSESTSPGTITAKSDAVTDYVYDTNGYPTKETYYYEDGTTVAHINEYVY